MSGSGYIQSLTKRRESRIFKKALLIILKQMFYFARHKGLLSLIGLVVITLNLILQFIFPAYLWFISTNLLNLWPA
jgi:uncharacterized membrane protein